MPYCSLNVATIECLNHATFHVLSRCDGSSAFKEWSCSLSQHFPARSQQLDLSHWHFHHSQALEAFSFHLWHSFRLLLRGLQPYLLGSRRSWRLLLYQRRTSNCNSAKRKFILWPLHLSHPGLAKQSWNFSWSHSWRLLGAASDPFLLDGSGLDQAENCK